jgi:arginine-tRNA-protein transferase
VTPPGTATVSLLEEPPLQLQTFYRSGPLPCPYIPGKTERKLFTRVAPEAIAAVNSVLTRAGFRRSHDIIYRPVCGGCQACVPVRIPVELYVPDRKARRTLKANADLAVEIGPAQATDEQFRLFRAYQVARHPESDMARMNGADYVAMIEDGSGGSVVLALRDAEGGLRGVMLTDVLEDGLSAVYSFFDPAEPKRSLGTLMILALVTEAARRGLPFVYLGYWIADARKMTYKRAFHPLEALTSAGWMPLPPADAP